MGGLQKPGTALGSPPARKRELSPVTTRSEVLPTPCLSNERILPQSLWEGTQLGQHLDLSLGRCRPENQGAAAAPVTHRTVR